MQAIRKQTILGLALGAIMLLGATVAVLTPSTSLAGSPKRSICEGSGGEWRGGRCVNPNESKPLEGSIKDVVNVMLFAIGAIAVIMIVIGGIKYTLSNGDSSAVTSAKNTIMYAVIGLVVAILAYAIVNFVIDQF